jgi:hypothetical protein
MPPWDPVTSAHLTDDVQAQAEAAFTHFLSDPDYFAALSMDPQAWHASDEAMFLSFFAEYSSLHVTAEQLIGSHISLTYGSAVSDAYWNAWLASIYGDPNADDVAILASAGVLPNLVGAQGAAELISRLGLTPGPIAVEYPGGLRFCDAYLVSPGGQITYFEIKTTSTGVYYGNALTYRQLGIDQAMIQEYGQDIYWLFNGGPPGGTLRIRISGSGVPYAEFR